MTEQTKAPPTVDLVKSRYQPSKAELEADARLGLEKPITLERLSHMASNVVKTVNIRWINRP